MLPYTPVCCTALFQDKGRPRCERPAGSRCPQIPAIAGPVPSPGPIGHGADCWTLSTEMHYYRSCVQLQEQFIRNTRVCQLTKNFVPIKFHNAFKNIFSEKYTQQNYFFTLLIRYVKETVRSEPAFF